MASDLTDLRTCAFRTEVLLPAAYSSSRVQSRVQPSRWTFQTQYFSWQTQLSVLSFYTPRSECTGARIRTSVRILHACRARSMQRYNARRHVADISDPHACRDATYTCLSSGWKRTMSHAVGTRACTQGDGRAVDPCPCIFSLPTCSKRKPRVHVYRSFANTYTFVRTHVCVCYVPCRSAIVFSPGDCEKRWRDPDTPSKIKTHNTERIRFDRRHRRRPNVRKDTVLLWIGLGYEENIVTRNRRT